MTPDTDTGGFLTVTDDPGRSGPSAEAESGAAAAQLIGRRYR